MIILNEHIINDSQVYDILARLLCHVILHIVLICTCMLSRPPWTNQTSHACAVQYSYSLSIALVVLYFNLVDGSRADLLLILTVEIQY